MSKTTIYFYIIGLLFFIFIRYIIGIDGLYGQDSYEYLRYTDVLNSFIINGSQPDNYFWPVYYPLIGSVLKIIIPSTSFVLQLISAISLITSLIFIRKIIFIVGSNNFNKINWYLAIFFLFSPMIFKLGFVCMSDMLSLLFILVSVYHYLNYFENKVVNSLYFSIIFTLLAVLTRYASFVVLFPFGFYLIFHLLKIKNHYIHLLFLFFISILIVFPHYYLKSQNPIAFLNHNWLQDWSLSNFFKKSFVTNDGTSNNFFPNIIYAISNIFHPRFFLFGVVLITIAMFRKIKIKYFWILFSSYVLYTLFLAGIPFQNNRFLLLSFPILILLLSPTYIYMSENKIFKQNQKIILLSLLLLNFSMCLYGLKPIYERNSFEKKMVENLEPYQNNTLYSFDIDIALKGRNLNFNFKNLWIKEYIYFEENSLLLFHPTKFKQQWENKNPIKNWEYLNNNYHLQVIKNCPEGWKLYKIKSKI